MMTASILVPGTLQQMHEVHILLHVTDEESESQRS